MSASAKRCQHMETMEILTTVFTTLSAIGESTGNGTDVRIRPVTPECLTAKGTFRRHYTPGGERLRPLSMENGTTMQAGQTAQNPSFPVPYKKQEQDKSRRKAKPPLRKTGSSLAENSKQSCGKQ